MTPTKVNKWNKYETRKESDRIEACAMNKTESERKNSAHPINFALY